MTIAPLPSISEQNAYRQGYERGHADAMSTRPSEAERRDAVLEEAAMIALKERCVHGTTWDLACTTIADAIFSAPEFTKAWESGKARADAEKAAQS